MDFITRISKRIASSRKCVIDGSEFSEGTSLGNGAFICDSHFQEMMREIQKEALSGLEIGCMWCKGTGKKVLGPKDSEKFLYSKKVDSILKSRKD